MPSYLAPPASSCIHLSYSLKLDQDGQAIEVQGAADAGRPAPRPARRRLPAPGRRRGFRYVPSYTRASCPPSITQRADLWLPVWLARLCCGVLCRVLRGQVRGAVRAFARKAGGVHEVLRAVLRGVRLRADGEERQPRRMPLLPRHAHRRAQEEAQVPLTTLSSVHRLNAPTASASTLPTGVVAIVVLDARAYVM